MSAAQQPNKQPFNAYTMADTTTKGTWIGGSYDAQTAITIAAACYQARQTAGTYPQLLIAVYDNTDTLVAFIGETP